MQILISWHNDSLFPFIFYIFLMHVLHFIILFLQLLKWIVLNQNALQCCGVKILLFLSSYLVPVQFTEVPQNITLNTSAPLFLSCDASGFPEPKIRWEKSGTTLSHTKQLNISSSNRNVAGEYACIASNGVRQEKTARAYVTVQCKSFLQYFIKSCHCY